MQDLKLYLDKQVAVFNNPSFIDSDPISIPHRFAIKQDIEISGFVTAILSWGNRRSIIAKSTFLMQLMENEPLSFLRNSSEKEFDRFSNFVYRTFNSDDCIFLLQALQQLYRENNSLEDVFVKGYQKDYQWQIIRKLFSVKFINQRCKQCHS